ncbi:uncharacterized protein SPPG_07513 [Spizellomyces punctatus DAOM BR117]|uniref:EF-hand domain-containing protein n=1 Tax=Spizellomyces punctatus (strain DAOM BR117) TaxID=645134 RepID=A0A0L0H6L3_SPIPD|nr:uncharacterized protein SPPG_07513 [Spizellomyces punctatus DAOM BR117]KNC97120.1 hypothetical protein SPPG_07513 [Spizellomyces punctatus DAOM BR117]|eukprot:XP_016605160.1 hypothetical protein SPPG_07513 [Spizellomyces punctatus DAOM BR117]
MLSILNPHDHYNSLLSFLPFSRSETQADTSGQCIASSKEVFSFRAYLESLASVAVVTVRAYAHYAAKFVPHEWAETVEGVLPAEVARLLKGLLSEDPNGSIKVESISFDEENAVKQSLDATSASNVVEIPDSVTEAARRLDHNDLDAEPPPCPASSHTVEQQKSSAIPHVQPSPCKKPTIPRFYTRSRPCMKAKLQSLMDTLQPTFMTPDGKLEKALSEREFLPVTEGCGLPRYLNARMFQRMQCHPPSVTSVDALEHEKGLAAIAWSDFTRNWRKLYTKYDGNIDSLTFDLLLPTGQGRAYLVPADFEVVVREIIAAHPSFDFLRSSPIFQDRYVETVIARIFYIKPTPAKHRMTLREYRKIKFLDMLRGVENADTCLGLSMPPPFSYKDFYVVYCRFWELDTDRDMLLTSADLERYSQGALTRLACRRAVDLYGTRVVVHDPEEGIPDANVRKGNNEESYLVEEKAFTFTDFVTFLLAVEDKTTHAAIEYWFHVLDLDQDGCLSLLELETMWAWQKNRLLDFEAYNLVDFFSVLMDSLHGKASSAPIITLSDLKRAPHAADMVFNLLFDARKREEWVRRTCDAGYRMADEVWLDIGKGETIWWEYGTSERDGATKIRLEGWPKFVEVAYRELLGAETTDEEEDDTSSVSSFASDRWVGGDE